MIRYQDLLCRNDERRAKLRLQSGLYGIDYLEVRTAPDADNQRVLELHFLETADETLDGFLGSLQAESFLLTGGVRIRDVRIAKLERKGDLIELTVSEPGDFSNYRLRVVHPHMDPVFAEVVFNFKAGCPSHFDCQPDRSCAPAVPAEPAIDYMARDYAGFRQALLDRIALTNPDWRERSPADLGIAVLELLAYAADHLSYYQDAVANEAYLETATQRISVRRHARLIDYRMHDGLSARTFIHFEVTKEGRIPQGTQVLTKLTAPWGGMPPPVPNVISAVDAAPASEAASAVFEVERSVHVDPALTAIPIYTWGRHECCLPRGATTADLQDERPFQPGDLMVFEEVKATTTGLAQDADRTHRQAVRLVAVSRIADPLEGTILTRVVWDSADALTTPFCLSFVNADGDCIDGVTTAHGNIALAHHGKRTRAKLNHVGRRVRLEEGPVSHWQITAACAPVASLLQSDPRQAAAAVDIRGWKQVDSLLDSDPNDSHFVAEIDNAGRAVVRFGDGAAGRVVPAANPPDADQLVVDYHVGLGPSGNVASDSIGHVILPEAPVDFPDITRVRNPLPAWGGTPPEPLEQVKLTAPASLRQGLLRAVTEEDYARAAEMLPEVSKAVATFRWTGTWHTVFLTVDPAGGTELTPELRRRVQKWVGRFLQTGYDLRIQEPVFVPLEVEVLVCTAANHFRADVMQALLRELGTGTLAGGRRAFFHPDQFTFGQPLFLSQLYAAIAAVPGVRAAQIRKLQRFGRPANNELENGVVRVGRTEVIRCDNNPNFAEHGVLRLQMEGSK